MNILITICARKGSTGLPGKHLLPFCGKPLIQWTFEQARDFASQIAKLDNSTKFSIVVSSDSEEILYLASDFGFTTRPRPHMLTSGIVPKMEVVRDCLLVSPDFIPGFIIDLDATNPMRAETDLHLALKMAKDNRHYSVLSAVKSRKNPYFNQVELGEDDFLWRVVKDKPVYYRQGAPKVFDLNASINIFSHETVLEAGSYTEKPFVIYEMDENSAFDIDSKLDMDIAEMLMGRRLGNV